MGIYHELQFVQNTTSYLHYNWSKLTSIQWKHSAWLIFMEVRQIKVVMCMTPNHLSTSQTETYTEELVEEMCHNDIYFRQVKICGYIAPKELTF